MKLNRNQPYGHILGHAWAKFEQNGILFGADGRAHETESVIEAAAKTQQVETGDKDMDAYLLSGAKTFLRKLLAGGPVEKNAVYRQAELDGHDWAVVTTAFAEIGGKTRKSGNTQSWRLMPEAVEGQSS